MSMLTWVENKPELHASEVANIATRFLTQAG